MSLLMIAYMSRYRGSVARSSLKSAIDSRIIPAKVRFQDLLFLGNRSSSFKLKPPSNPKPPTFFEQAYMGKTRLKRMISERSASVANVHPYSSQIQDDAASYMEQGFRSVSRKSSRSDHKKDLDQESHTQKSVYEEPDEQLIRGQKTYLNKRNLNRVARGRTLGKMASLRSQTSSKQKRLTRLRQKYAHMLKLDKDFAKCTLDVTDDAKVTITKDDQEPEAKSETKSEDGSEPEKEDSPQKIEPNPEENPYEDQNYATVVPENNIDDEQKSEDVSTLSKQSKLDQILSELHEERKKRKELESVVQELLSRSGVTKVQLKLEP